MILAKPIQSFFDADARNDVDALVGIFASDAVVLDESETHRGRDEIRRWWQKTKAAYGARAEPLDLTNANGRSRVRARMTGSFPGSPVVLTFAFALADDRIAELEIK